MRSRRLYLDEAAATPVDQRVLKAMQPYWADQFGNPASLHREGVAAKQAIETARKTVAACLEAHPDEIIFTSGGTEANNLALFGAAAAQADRRHLVLSNIEHPSVREAAAELEKRGYVVTEVPVGRDGIVAPEVFSRALRDDTLLASVSYANNEIGTIQPIAALGKLCLKRRVLLHTDACQAAPWLPLRVDALHVDYLTANAAKLHGPKGVGLLYKRRGAPLKPLLFGGGQESGRRSGTENVPGIVGFAEAFRLTRERLSAVDRVRQVRDALIVALLELPGVTLNGHRHERLPNNVNVSVAGIDGETLLLGLDAAGIAASSGSACSSLHPDGSAVLKAIGASTGGNVRFSLGWTASSKDVARVVAAVKQILERQRPLQKQWEQIVYEKTH